MMEEEFIRMIWMDLKPDLLTKSGLFMISIPILTSMYTALISPVTEPINYPKVNL